MHISSIYVSVVKQTFYTKWEKLQNKIQCLVTRPVHSGFLQPENPKSSNLDVKRQKLSNRLGTRQHFVWWILLLSKLVCFVLINIKYHHGKFPGKSASIRPPTVKNWTKLDQMTPGSPKNQDYFRKGARKSPKSGRFSHSAGSVTAAPAHAAQEGGVLPGPASNSVQQ